MGNFLIERIHIVLPIGERTQLSVMAEQLEEIAPGRFLPANPIDLLVGPATSALPSQVASAIESINHAKIAELTSSIESLTAEKATLQKSLDESMQAREESAKVESDLQAEVSRLIAEMETLKAQPAEVVATNAQIRKWLIHKFGPNAEASVDAIVESIEDPTVRALAKADWNFANVVERDNPLVHQLGLALGLSAEQLDVSYQEATKL